MARCNLCAKKKAKTSLREALHRLQVLENLVLLHLIRVFSVDLTSLQPPALLEGACQGMFRALFAEAARRMDSFKPREMQSLSVLCAQPLGLENAGDMSAGDLRSCCFALATTGGPAHQPLTLLDELLEDQEIFWDPDPVEAPPVRPRASGSTSVQPIPAGVPFVQPMVGWPLEAMQPGGLAPLATSQPCPAAMPGWPQPGRSFYPPPKSRRVERPTEPPKPPRVIEAPSASRWSRIGREVDKLRRESSCSISGTDDWAGGLRSCASESSSLESNFEVRKGKGGKGKGKGKMKGWIISREGSISTESASVIGGSLTTSLELPLSVLRSSWKAAVAEASSAHIEVDASRRDGFGRLIIVGSWKQSLLAYQCLMPLFFNSKDPRVDDVEVPSDSQVSQGSRMPGFGPPAPEALWAPGYPQQDGLVNRGQGADAPQQNIERQDQPSDPRGENKFVYSVKNTFLHVEDSEEDQEDLSGASQPWLSEASLGPPLQFLPKDIELNELQAFRADYMKFRAGQATGARGEIQDVAEVIPLASESTVGALDLQTAAGTTGVPPGVQ
eukprot:symbB.v1.2.004069.t4/scaffold229.1/size262426/12